MEDASAKASEQDLLNGLKSSDQAQNNLALKQLYQLYYQDVEKFTITFTGNVEDAKDVFQDAVVAIYRMVKDDKYPANCPIKAYFIAICKNLLLKKKKMMKTVTEDEHLKSVADSAQTALEHLQTTEKSRSLLSVVHQLGEECKAILTSYYFENLSYKEICQKLVQVSEDSVKMKKKRCMNRLKELLGDNPNLQMMLK